MSTMIPNATALVNYIKDFTGSSNNEEIKQCIYLAELMMRNLEIPALRTDPYTTIGIADSNGYVPIPADMNKPILFFNQGTPGTMGSGPNSGVGPWIVYDRIGDRDIITEGLIENLYLQPVNIPQVYRGKFSEVGQNYHFLPGLGGGAMINLYYYRTWALLFSAEPDTQLNATGTIIEIDGDGPWTSIVDVSSTAGMAVGEYITAVPGTGTLDGGTTVITAVDSNTNQIVLYTTSGTGPVAGTISDITIVGQFVENNPVLQSWPEGYVYGTLHNYYYKRKMSEDADKWLAKYNLAWDTVEDQNNKGKWSGGHNRLTSIFQPRKDRRYSAR